MFRRLARVVEWIIRKICGLNMVLPNAQTPPSSIGSLPVVVSPFLDGGDVALEVLQAIGYRTVLKTATIVSFNMQDYDFWGHGVLSHLLLRQLALGASVRLMTTPPPGKATSAGFKSKYTLLSELQKNGVAVFLNDKLHAKAYLFLDTNGATTAIVGSANLTGPGFGMHLAPHDNLVEMASISEDGAVLQHANDFVDTKILNDARTEDFATWFARNSVEIGKAGL
jgi:PLD-like domain